jgi:hypothetical protein
MTAAIAGAAARGGASKAAAGTATRGAAAKSTATGGARAGGRAKGSARPPSQAGYRDALMAGDQKKPVDQKPPPAAGPTAPTVVNVSTGGAVSSGAGFVLALLFWTWVGVPLIQRGPNGVRDQLRAKFLNKAPDGSWLP